MAVPHWPFVATVVLFLHPHGGLPAHPTACLGHSRAPVLLNCSSSGLSLAPQHIQATVSELDLSHNLLNSISLRQPYPDLKNIWLGNNSIRHLSLCVERTVRGQATAHPRRSRSQRRQGCVSWAPSLQLLSVERNQLVQFPEGLGGCSESLQVLQLAYNRISTLQPADVNALRQLRELHLQHNRITSLHPQALTPLSQLRVLDLSFNLLSTITPLTYLSLRSVRVGVDLGGNRWRCDCSMQSVRRWMAFDTDRGHHHDWRMVCASPSALSGRDLLRLDEDHLTCSTADSSTPGQHHHQDITVDEGSEILLPCGTTHQVSTWWTPQGEVPLKLSQPGLLISNITKTDTGLYVCVTESQQGSLSVFNLQIRKTESKSRSPRSVPRGLIPQDSIHRVANGTDKYPTQSDLALAVSLSVIITFLVAFIIGVLLRPCIDILWRRMCTKKETSATYDVSAAEQRPYDNEAYSDGEESVENERHRERRVTFSTVDHSNEPYYDTVANQENTSRDVVIGGGMTMTQSEETGSDGSSQQGSPEMKGRGGRELQDDPHQGPAHRMEFEHIPDPSDQGERGSLSSHSDSSHSDKEQKDKLLLQKDPHAPQFPQQAEDAFQQRSEATTTRPVEVSQTSIEGTGFTCEPFSEWPPNMNDQNLRDPDLWNDSGEKFDFSDSIRSGSARSSSLFGSFNRSNQNVLPSSDKWKHADNSSSSSSMSGDEPTQYTINSEGEEEGHVEATQLTHDTKVEIVNPCLKQDASSKQQGHGEDPFRASLRDEEFNQAECRNDTQSPSVGLEHSDSSHSIDSDGGHTQYTVTQDKEEEKMEWMVSEIDKQESRLPEAEQTGLGVGDPHPGKHLKSRAPLAPAAQLPSSSSESEAETADRVEVRRDQMELEMTSPEPDTSLPALDLQNIPKVKRHLDIKVRSSPQSDSSSSENEYQITGHTIKQNVPQTKRNAPLPPNLSSSSKSEEETVDLTVKLVGHKAFESEITSGSSHLSPVSLPSNKAVRTNSSDSESSSDETESGVATPKLEPKPESRWPDLDLSSVPHVKRRLDIKVLSPTPPDSPCDGTAGHKVKQEWDRADMEISHREPQTTWPDTDLSAVSPGPIPAESSSSSSESEDEMRYTASKPEREVGAIEREAVPHPKETLAVSLTPKRALNVTLKNSADITDEAEDRTTADISPAQRVTPELESRWAGVTLGVSHLREDTGSASPKVPSALLPESSSSSSESEDEHQDRGVKQTNTGDVLAALGVPRLKRRMDIKSPEKPPPAPPSQRAQVSSSSSESEDEMGKGRRETPALHLKSQSSKVEKESKQTESGLSSVLHIKRRLDIKAASPLQSESSSSSEDERSHQTKEHDGDRLDLGNKGPKPETKWPNLDFSTIPVLKRRLDIKGPLPDNSFSFSRKDKGADHTIKLGERYAGNLTSEPGIHVSPKVPSALLPESSSSSSESEDEHQDRGVKQTNTGTENTGDVLAALGVPRLKRRMDIKSPEKPPPAPPSQRTQVSSSSSESEDEMGKGRTKEHDGDRLDLGSKGPKPETKWPKLDFSTIPVLKRRLDIKGPLPDDSSSFRSKDEGADHTFKLGERDARNLTSEPEKNWPLLDLNRIPGMKSSLDIKAASPLQSESSSSSEDERSHQTKEHDGYRLDLGSKGPKPETKWPKLDFSTIPVLKRRLDIKGPLPDDSSSFKSKDEGADHTIKQGERDARNLTSEPRINVSLAQQKAPLVEVSLTPKRALNITLKNSAGITDEAEDRTTADISPAQRVTPEFESRWAGMTLGVSRLRKHTGSASPKVPSAPLPESSSSSSESEDEHQDRGVKQTNTGTENTGDVLAALGVPRLKRRMDIKSPEKPPPAPPSQRAQVSSSSSESEDEMGKGRRESESSSSSEDERSHQTKEHDGDLGSKGPKPETKWPNLDFSTIPVLKRRLDIKAPLPDDSSSFRSKDEGADQTIKLGERDARNLTSEPRINVSLAQPKAPPALHFKSQRSLQSESSSSSEDERSHQTKEHDGDRLDLGSKGPKPETKWPKLDFSTIPVLKRRLDIKAPLPDDSFSFRSKDEGADQTIRLGERDARNLTSEPEKNWPLLDLNRVPGMKRSLDIKAPSPGDGFVHHSKSAISVSEERHAVKSDLSASNSWRPVNVQPQQRAPPAVPGKHPPFTSSSSSDSEDDKKKHKITPPNPYSSVRPMSTSLQPRGALNLDIKFDNTSSTTDGIDGKVYSEDRRERKGLGALKALSSNRENWDSVHEELERSSSQHTDQYTSYHGHTTFKYQATRDIKPLFSSTSTDGTKAAGMRHGISQLSSHTVVDTQPPPVPGSPPPEEDGVAVPTWRSPKISEKQDGAYSRLLGSTSFTSRSSVANVERSPSLIGMGVATPYHTTRGYRSITSTTTQILRTESNVTNTSSKTSTLHFDQSNITEV